jgi:type VI secretion system protein ImpH
MATAGRRPEAPLINALVARPGAFDFFQAVRLLEAEGAARGRRPVGFDFEPREESVRLRGDPSLAFPVGAIRDVELPPADAPAPPSMRVSFLGFLGAVGVLPQHWTELVMRRAQQRDSTLLDWLDLLLHRTLSLYYRAWRKQRPAFALEHALRHGATDDVTFALRALIGLATPRLANRQAVADASLLHFAGQLAHRPRSAAALAGVASGWLRMPVHVRQFVGHWLELEPADRSRMPSRAAPNGNHHRLGVDLFLGARVHDVVGRIRLEVGPVGAPEYLAILPGEPGHRGLAALVRAFVDPGVECDLEIQFLKERLPTARLSRDDALGARLGRDAWVGEPRRRQDALRERFPLTTVA